MRTYLFSLVALVVAAVSAVAQTTFSSPVPGGTVSHPFNDTQAAHWGWYHTGQDIVIPQSTWVRACNVGTVVAIVINGQNDHGFGNAVILKHDVIVSSNGATAPYYSLVAHLDNIAVNLACGQRVARGQVLGGMGSSGYGNRYYWGTTPHTHFEIKTSPTTQNPYGGGPFWGYTPNPAQSYGYINPAWVVGSWQAR